MGFVRNARHHFTPNMHDFDIPIPSIIFVKYRCSHLHRMSNRHICYIILFLVIYVCGLNHNSVRLRWQPLANGLCICIYYTKFVYVFPYSSNGWLAYILEHDRL